MADNEQLKYKMLCRAKMYLDDMREGLDPVRKTALPEDSVVRQQKVINCFTFLSELLAEMIDASDSEDSQENAPEETKQREHSTEQFEIERDVRYVKEPFHIRREQLRYIRVSKSPVAVSTFIRRINEVVDRETTKLIRAKDIHGWLSEKGFIEERSIKVVKEEKEYWPSKEALSIGVLAEVKAGTEGQEDKHLIKLSDAAQQFVLDNIDDIAEYAKLNK